MARNVTAIVPVYNEADNIKETLNAIKQLKHITQIIVINDGSKDNTFYILKEIKELCVLNSQVNKGKGYAIKAALPYVHNEYVLMADGDLRDSAAELAKLLDHEYINTDTMLVAKYPKPLKKGGIGLLKGLSRRSLYFFTAKTLSSVLSGQRLLSTDFLKEIEIPDDFGVEFKITLEALRRGMKVIEIPVNIRHRESGRDIKGMLHRGKQLIDIFKVIIKELV